MFMTLLLQVCVPALAPPADSKTLGVGTWIGIASSCLVGVSALVAIAYNVWKWRNKHKLLAVKANIRTSLASSHAVKQHA
jgi:hypothetical protein